MGQALYRKYRSRSLNEVIGQEHVTTTLNNALKQGRISHAYLLTGPRGVGKTSVARILAHEINNLPYKADESHIDIIEIDAASNRRIDEIRELRDKVHIAPTSAKYKVYIIDEVHMLTREAFNALLKTLEEPPEHAVFILATTDAHKLPETIISRTQRFSFKPVATDKVVAHLKTIAKQEKIKISDEALKLLAEHGEGSFRDSISLLDQAGNHASKVELADVQRLLGMPPDQSLGSLVEAIFGSEGNTAQVINVLDELYGQGYQAAAIAKRLGESLRARLLAGSLPSQATLDLLQRLINVPVSPDPERFLEIVLISSAKLPQTSVDDSTELPSETKSKPKPQKSPSVQSRSEPPSLTEPIPQEKTASRPASIKKSSAEPVNSEIWPQVLKAIKARHNTLYGIVRMAEPDFTEAGTIKLVFSFPFHQKRVNESANRQKIVDIVFELTGQNVEIECLHNANAKAADLPLAVEPTMPVQTDNSADLSTISNIFGETELLES